MVNLAIRECEHATIDTLNSFDIPIEAKRLIAQNILNLLSKDADLQVSNELQAAKEAKNAESIQQDNL